MTLCECASEMRSERSAIALVDNDDRDSIMIVSAMYEDQRPAKVSFITYKSESCSWVAGSWRPEIDLWTSIGATTWDGVPYE